MRRERGTVSRRRAHRPDAANRQTPALHLTLVDHRRKLKLAGRNPGGSKKPVATSRDDAGTTTTASLVRRPRRPRLLPRSAKKESVLDRLVALHPLEEMDF